LVEPTTWITEKRDVAILGSLSDLGGSGDDHHFGSSGPNARSHGTSRQARGKLMAQGRV